MIGFFSSSFSPFGLIHFSYPASTNITCSGIIIYYSAQGFAEIIIAKNRPPINRACTIKLKVENATRVNYENIRINADDYDFIDYDIERILDPEEVIEEETESTKYVPPRTDEEELRQEVRNLDILEETARHVSFYVNTDYNRQRIKELLQKIAEKEHRFFKIVNEFNPERSRYALVLKEITPDEQKT